MPTFHVQTAHNKLATIGQNERLLMTRIYYTTDATLI